jgi:hypothetical protein
MQENNDFDFYEPKKRSKAHEKLPEEPTVLGGYNFYSGMRFTIVNLLFEVVKPNHIYCVESYLDCPERFRNTVFDVSDSNCALFFEKMGLDMGKVRKCYSEPKNSQKGDIENPNLLINKLDLEWSPK